MGRARGAASLPRAIGALCLAAALWVSSLPVSGQASSPILDVPFVPQRPELCGGAAVSMVVRYWGGAGIISEDFAHLVTDDARGIRAGDLRQAVEELGWRAVSFRGDPQELRRQLARGRPVLVLLRVGPDRYHYVVVVGSLEGRVVLHDPALGAYRTPTAERMLEAWEAAGRWAMLVLPEGRDERPSLRERSATSGSSALVPATGGHLPEGADRSDAAPASVPSAPAPCEALVARGVAHARADRLEEAEGALEAAVSVCPGAKPLRELAGLRLRAGDPASATSLAEQALAADPSDVHAVRTLAAARYLDGDEQGALEAWNRLGGPRIDLVRVEGARRFPQIVARRHLGLEAGRPLRSADLGTARRRLSELPAAAASRIALVPRSDGSAEVVAFVQERPANPLTAGALLATGIRGVVERELWWRAAGLVRGGELWTVGVRMDERRPRVWFGLEAPASLPPPGAVWRVGGFWEEQSYRDPAVTAADQEQDLLKEERVRGDLEVSRWETAAVRWRVGVAADRWSGRAAHPAAVSAGEVRLAGDRLALGVAAEGWAGTGEASAFGRAQAVAEWRSRMRRTGLTWYGRLGAVGVSAEAPRAVWPGAGEGRARPMYLRAHPLLQDGAVTGPAFGRHLLHGGLEAVAWVDGLAVPAVVGAAAFLDLAAAGARPGRPEFGPLHADVGLGLRLGVPGQRGALRVDVARGVRDGVTALTAGWEMPWPRLIH